MSITMQLIQLLEEDIVEVSGISEISGMYLENTDVDISAEYFVDDKTIRLSIKPKNKKKFIPISFDIQIIAQRILVARLLNGSKVIIVPKSIDEKWSDTPAIRELLQRTGGIWLDGLPRESIREIVKYCSY
jgi:hypothetical protein